MKSLKLFIFLLLALLTSCGTRYVPRLPADIPDLVSGNCLLPRETSELMAVMDWNDFLRGTPLEGHAPVEVFPLIKDVGENSCGEENPVFYCGGYNWNQGRPEGERRPMPLDRNKTYIVLEVDALIAIVTYLKEYVWSKFVDFLRS